VPEPSVEETVAILRGLKSRFEAHHGIKYSGNALTSAAELSARYINDRHLPDKAIDVIDEAGAAQKICPSPSRKGRRQNRDRGNHLQDCAHPPGLGVAGRPRRPEEPRPRFEAVVFGQDQAIEALVSAIRTARSGLANPRSRSGISFSRSNGCRKNRSRGQLAYCMAIELQTASTCPNTWSGTPYRA